MFVGGECKVEGACLVLYLAIFGLVAGKVPQRRKCKMKSGSRFLKAAEGKAPEV